MGEWIGWKGGECPVVPHEVVEVMSRDERILNSPCYADVLTWEHTGDPGDIVAYRILANEEPASTIASSAIAANDNHPQEDAFTAPQAAPPADVKASIADEAKRIVSGARRAAYGAPEDNFGRIAAYWNAYAQCKGWPVVFTAADVSPMMRGMKEARLAETPDHRDSFVDLVGYTLTGAEINRVAA